VLREVLSVADRQRRPAFSGLFSTEVLPVATSLDSFPDGDGTVVVAPPRVTEVVIAHSAPRS
jgi:hypothetical protein